MAWRTVLEFEALYDLYAPWACHCEIFSTAYLLQMTTIGARYFILQSGVKKIIINMMDRDRGMRDTMVWVSSTCDADLEEERGLSRLSRIWMQVFAGGPCLPPMLKQS